MTTTLERPLSTVVVDAVETAPGRVLLDDQDQFDDSPAVVDRAEQRHRQAKQLAVLVDGDREPLEELRARFQRRLHRASDDFDASEQLRTVELALSMTPRLAGPLTWQRRERRRGRWWRRRRGPQ